MNKPVIFVISLVQHLEIAEGHIADCHVKEAVGHLHLFKAVHHNAAVLIELLGDPAGYAVYLNPICFRVSHRFGQHTDEIPNTTRWFQNIPGLETHLSQHLIHGIYDNGGGVKGCQATGSCGGVLVLVKQGFQFQVLTVALVKAICQTAPAYIAG